MRKRELGKRIRSALKNINDEISINSASGSSFAAGLAGEGMAGGWRDALQDVLLLLDDIEPSYGRGYWKERDDA